MNRRPEDTRSEAEVAFHNHMIRWGSDGFPISKVRSGWIWGEFHGVRGAPTVYRTKRAASEAIEKYIDILCDKSAGRA